MARTWVLAAHFRAMAVTGIWEVSQGMGSDLKTKVLKTYMAMRQETLWLEVSLGSG